MHQTYKPDSQAAGRAFQYQFDLQIQKVRILKSIEIPPSSFMEVIWRRGQNNITTKRKSQVKGNEEDVEFNEKLSMISTCYLNMGAQNKNFNQKQSIVSVIININGSQKLFGSLNINLSQVLNASNYRESGTKYIEQELNGRTKSRISLKLTSTYLKEMVKSDQQSVSSSNNYHNTSNYSIGFSQQNTDKKIKQSPNLINQIPSKDAYSVMSYGGSAKYSYRRQEQQSSSNLLKRQDSNSKYDQKSITYGYYGNTNSSNNFYNKTMNEYNLNRNSNTLSAMNQTSTSVARPSRNSDSQNNKSTLGEQNSRLLAEQQNKRSKLEAQNTKSRVQNSQLKSKLTEYVRENMKLKQQIQKLKSSSDGESHLKEQNQELINKNQVFAQEIRQLKSKFDQYSLTEKQYGNLKKNSQNSQKQIDQYNATVNRLNTEIQELHYALNQSKNNENCAIRELRELQNSTYNVENKYRKEIQEANQNFKRQISKQQTNIYTLQQNIREKQRKINQQQQELKQLQLMHNQQEQSQRHLSQELRGKQLQLKQLYEQYGNKIKEYNNQASQIQSLRAQTSRLEEQKKSLLSEHDKTSRFKDEISVLQSRNQELLMKNNDLINEKTSLLNQIRQQSLTSRRQSDKYRQLQSLLAQQKSNNAKQINRLTTLKQRLESENTDLKQKNAQKTRIIDDLSKNRVESDGLMKHNLQIQLELKYKAEKLANLEHLQQDYQNVVMQKSIIEKNHRQLQQINEKLEKELKQKNRALILETQKNKMLTQDKTNTNKGYLQLKQQLQHTRQIITNGDKQVKEMDQYIYQLECRNNELEKLLKDLQLQRTNKDELQKSEKQKKQLQERVKELENRNNQKLLTLEKLNKNLAISKDQIKELQLVSEERHHEIINRDNYIQELDGRLQESQKNLNLLEEDLIREQQQKKSNIKKAQMLMEQLFVYKKKLEQERGRSQSSTFIRSSEDFMKIRNLENQLQKRDERISKLQKQLINLQDQNVKLNIEIMKKLQALKQSGITPKEC